jgi:hypothetical protein
MTLKALLATLDRSDSPAAMIGFIAIGSIVIAQLVLYSATDTAPATAYLWSVASLASGTLIGFLFGVPKVLQDQLPAPGGYRQVVNTNLEQISDWLTKVVVGISLVNARELLDKLKAAARVLSKALGGSDIAFALAVGTIVYFSVIGFLTAYLLTRLYLTRAFFTNDQPRPAPTLTTPPAP